MATSSCLRGLLRTSSLRGPFGFSRSASRGPFKYQEALLTGPTTQVTILSNGVRVASENSGLPTATVGVFVDSGSRHETSDLSGITSMFHQVAQKGTASKTKDALATEVEGIGARVTSEAGREHMGFSISSLKEHLPNAVGVLSELLQRPALTEEGIEGTRAGLLQQQADLEHDLESVVWNQMHSNAFQGTALANPVLGTSMGVKSITRADLQAFGKSICRGPRVYLVASGGVDHDSLVKIAEQQFGKLPSDVSDIPKIKPARFTGSCMLTRDDDMQYVHGAVAVESVGYSHPDRLALEAAKLIVGSHFLSYGTNPLHVFPKAAFNLNAYDHFVKCQGYNSFNVSYNDTGLWGFQFVCEETSADDSLHYIMREWTQLCSSAREAQVDRAKNILKTQLYGSLDGPEAVVKSTARELMVLGRRIPLQEMDQRIDALDAQWVRRAMNTHVYDKDPVSIGVGPTECYPELTRLISKTQWVRL